MYVHTNMRHIVIPPVPTHSTGCRELWTLINKGISAEPLLKVMETDGCWLFTSSAGQLGHM